MKFVKPFLFVASGFFILITLISLLIPSQVMTTKSVTIHSPKEKIGSAIKDLQMWRYWHPVFKADSAAMFISSPSNVAGAYADWEQSGKKNRMTITEVFAEGIKINLERPGEKAVENSLLVLPMEEAGTFHVEWRSLTKLKWYPWEKFAGIFVSDMTGPGYEAALNELKKFVEISQ
jgi:hypothetical protein